MFQTLLRNSWSRKILDRADVGTCDLWSVITTPEFFQHHFALDGSQEHLL